MNASEDIRNLFGKFEGKTQQYQEVTRDDQAIEARSRWPLLSSVALDETDRVPDVADSSARLQDSDATQGGDALAGTWHARVASDASTAARASASASATPGPAPSSLRGALFGARSSQSPQEDTPSGGAAEPLHVARASEPASTPSPVSSYGNAEPSGPTSAFAPPRAPGPRPAPLPFLRDAAPAFHVRSGPTAQRASGVSSSSAASPTEAQAAAPVASVPMQEAPLFAAAPAVSTESPASSAAVTPTSPAAPGASPAPTASVAFVPSVRGDAPPPVLRRAAPSAHAATVTPLGAAPVFASQGATSTEAGPSAPAAGAFPAVVTPETSKRRAFHSRDFAPPVVPVNHYKPSAASITGNEAELDYGALRASREPGAIPSGSILGKLFAPAVQTPAQEEAPATDTGSRDLRSVFSRLAGGAGGVVDRGEDA